MCFVILIMLWCGIGVYYFLGTFALLATYVHSALSIRISSDTVKAWQSLTFASRPRPSTPQELQSRLTTP
jgi:hypothetical protein